MTDQIYPRPGSIALVTGAGSGIGKAIAEALVAVDCRVICTGRRLPRVDQVAARLGNAAIALQLDVSSDDSVSGLFERLPGDWRDIDILINNAGHDVGGRRRFGEGEMSGWADIIETNVIGLMRVTHEIIDGMIARDHGHIVNIGSTAGLNAYAKGTIYAGSKHAVHGFTQSLRMDYAGTGVRVSEIMPGMVRTEFAATRWGDKDKAEKFYDDWGGCLTPEDVARALVFVLQQPAHVAISQLVIKPSTEQ